MFRILSNGLAAVGLAAVIALVALMSGSVASKPAEAAPGSVTLQAIAGTACGTSTVATAIVTTPDPGTTVTFVSSNPSIASVPGGAVSAAGGSASVTVTTYANMPGTAAITATVTGLPQSTQNVTVTCTVNNNCQYYPASCNTCTTYPYTNCGTGCDPIYGCGNNCYYGTVYTCGNVGGCYNGGLYGAGYNCGANCGLSYYSGCGANCGGAYLTGCGGYNGCGNTYYSNYGCVGNCAGALSYLSCTPPTCGNINGPILNCSNSYVPSGNLQYVPGRVSILPSASTIACGGATAITVVVSDPNGFKVPDGTNVTFTTTLGYIQSSDQTQGGTAVASLTIPPGTSGNAKVTAAAGGQSSDTTINVTCASGAPAVAVQTLPAAPAIPFPFPFPTGGRPSILPPSTGDAGLAAE